MFVKWHYRLTVNEDSYEKLHCGINIDKFINYVNNYNVCLAVCYNPLHINKFLYALMAEMNDLHGSTYKQRLGSLFLGFLLEVRTCKYFFL